MKDYTKFMQWALFTITDRKTQDDRKSKIRVEALFSCLLYTSDAADD